MFVAKISGEMIFFSIINSPTPEQIINYSSVILVSKVWVQLCFLPRSIKASFLCTWASDLLLSIGEGACL